MNDVNVRKNIKYAFSYLAFKYPFFYSIMAIHPPLEYDNKFGIMETDNVNIFFNTDNMSYVKKNNEFIPKMAYYSSEVGRSCEKVEVSPLEKEEIVFLLIHEVLHIYLQHFSRFGEAPNKYGEVEVVLCLEYATNGVIIDELMSNNLGITIPKFKPVYDEMFKGWNAEKILKYLLEEKKENPKKFEERCSGISNSCVDSHIKSMKTTIKKMKEIEKMKGKSIESQIADFQSKMYNIYKTIKTRGDVPNFVERFMDKYLEKLKGSISWKDIIKMKINDIGKDTYTFSKFNQRHLHRGIGLPGLKSETGKLAMALDTSASISEKELISFIGEIGTLLRRYPNLELIIYGVDCEMKGKEKIKGKREFNRTKIKNVLTGGGGTSFIPVWKDLIETKDNDIKFLFYFTDGYGDQENIINKCGTKGNWNTFWCLPETSKHIKFPFGKSIIIKD